MYGAVARDRTLDLVINSHTLYLLSYNGSIPYNERVVLKHYASGNFFLSLSTITMIISRSWETFFRYSSY